MAYDNERSQAMFEGAKEQRNALADHVLVLLGAIAERDAEIAVLKAEATKLKEKESAS